MLTTDYGSEPHSYSAQEQAVTGAVTELIALIIERERLVTERAQAEARELALRDANERMSEFLSIASHELRTPVTTLKANVQLVSRRVHPSLAQDVLAGHVTPAELAEVLTRVSLQLARADWAMTHLIRLVDDLLDVSRIQAGKLEFRIAPCDLATIVQGAVEEQRQLHPSRSIVAELPEGAVQMTADAQRLTQVVTNYLTNALKYSKADRPVQVRLDVTGGQARVRVRDRGPGLAPDQHERVWERFIRVPGIEVQSGSGIGLGLGLHISRTIIERHGGQVGVDSELGVGSTFWFTVPLAATDR
jgi:signal transduction histidine kinase